MIQWIDLENNQKEEEELKTDIDSAKVNETMTDPPINIDTKLKVMNEASNQQNEQNQTIIKSPPNDENKSNSEFKRIQETLKQLQQEQQNQNKQLSNIENENKSLKSQQENMHNELQNVKQNITKLTKENNDLKQELNGIKSKLQQLDADSNKNDEEKKEPLDELKDFLTNNKYKVQLPDYYDILKEEGFDDMEILKEIKDEDLLDIGIRKKAHRMKIVRGIAILRAEDKNNDNSNNDANVAAPAAYANDYVEGPNVVNTKR